MSDKIVAIHGGGTLARPVDDVIAELEMLLDRARSGQLRGLAYATISDAVDGISSGHSMNMSVGTGWTGAAGTRYPLGSAVSMLFHRYHQRLLEG